MTSTGSTKTVRIFIEGDALQANVSMGDVPSKEINIEVPESHMWFVEIVVKLLLTFVQKNRDYAGATSDWKENFLGGGLKGVYNRMNDKMFRLRNFLRGQVLNNEGFEDSCEDLAVYSLIMRQAKIEEMSIEGLDWKGYN